MNESGSEHLYTTLVQNAVANFGVSILDASPGSIVDPWVLGSKDENDVQGYTGTPVDVNSLTYDANLDIGAAGAEFPRQQRFYVVVDSGSDEFTGAAKPGSYVLNAWENDVTPPSIRILSRRVSAGRPLLIAQAVDDQSGVDPLSPVIGYGTALVAPSAYDPSTGLLLFGLPTAAPKLTAGKITLQLRVSDYQESKNVDTPGTNLLPNTAFASVKLQVVNGPAATWILPDANTCAEKTERLVVSATSTAAVTKVVFRDGAKQIALVRKGSDSLYDADVETGGWKKGKHVLSAAVTDRSGRTAKVLRTIRVCG
jgi:hypothetical protein